MARIIQPVKMASNRDEFMVLLGRLGWSQARLARSIGVHRNTVTHWVLGRRRVPGSVLRVLGEWVRAKETWEEICGYGD